MQKKMGIRLRHLENINEPSQHQNNIIGQPNYDQGRKRQRSPSPMNRRKIFPNAQSYQPQSQFQHIPKQVQPQQQTQYPPQYQTQTNNKAKHQYEIPRNSSNQIITSPIMNQPLNYSLTDQTTTNQYQAQIDRLVESLKKKSLEMERKDQLINKLRKQIQLLKAENGSYTQQIKTLKAQLQFVRATNNKNVNLQNKKIVGRVIQQNYNNEINNGISQSRNNVYRNQPYQQFVPERDRVRVMPISNKNNYQQQMRVKKTKIIDEPQRQQDSVISDYLSPLMILQEENQNKGISNSRQVEKRTTPPKSSKTNSRVDYNIPNKYAQQQQKFALYPNNSNADGRSKYQLPPTSPIQNPFSKKANQQQHHPRSLTTSLPSPFQPTQPQFPNTENNRKNQNYNANFGSNTLNKFNTNTNDYNINSNYQINDRNQRKLPTLQSSAAHFNVNFLQQDTQHIIPKANSERNYREREKNKQLAIQDSKQFRFEDFDFSELDNSLTSKF